MRVSLNNFAFVQSLEICTNISQSSPKYDQPNITSIHIKIEFELFRLIQCLEKYSLRLTEILNWKSWVHF